MLYNTSIGKKWIQPGISSHSPTWEKKWDVCQTSLLGSEGGGGVNELGSVCWRNVSEKVRLKLKHVCKAS